MAVCRGLSVRRPRPVTMARAQMATTDSRVQGRTGSFALLLLSISPTDVCAVGR